MTVNSRPAGSNSKPVRSTIEPPEKCELGCECGDTGYVEVVNEGQFATEANTVMLPCHQLKGHWIHYHRYGNKRGARYDPATMHLAGEVFQKKLFH